MKFQICTCNYPSFAHGHFFDEHGPYLFGEGLEHLSDNFFCQEEALSFIQEALVAGKVTEAEANALKEDKALLTLPVILPPDVEEYIKQGPEVNRKMLLGVIREIRRIEGITIH